MSKRQNAEIIDEPFVMRRLSMLNSAAFTVLSLAAHRVLTRIEIEHLQHGRKENGNLMVTYTQFEDYGIDRHAIGPAVREVVALGFVAITEQGRAGNGEYRRASKYRLTYCPAKGAMGSGTHEWRGVGTLEEAKALAKAARSERDPTNISVIRKRRRPTKQRSIKAENGHEVAVLQFPTG